jgi:hypothetical protein
LLELVELDVRGEADGFSRIATGAQLQHPAAARAVARPRIGRSLKRGEKPATASPAPTGTIGSGRGVPARKNDCHSSRKSP